MVTQEQHVATDDARAGVTNHNVRYVLGISLALAVIAMLLLLWL
ncbi:hypothetical protein U5A82_14935 [Sphingobium sp. CR2-8]|nr:hypothetical protein [Sphingobium sp. CR2-8]MEC3911714.1 hypothetical protein [Sphingobium sp. CR2-8]